MFCSKTHKDNCTMVVNLHLIHKIITNCTTIKFFNSVYSQLCEMVLFIISFPPHLVSEPFKTTLYIHQWMWNFMASVYLHETFRLLEHAGSNAAVPVCQMYWLHSWQPFSVVSRTWSHVQSLMKGMVACLPRIAAVGAVE